MELNNLTIKEINEKVSSIDFEKDDIEEIIRLLSLDNRTSVKKLSEKVYNKFLNFQNNKMKNQEFYNFDRSYEENENFVLVGCDEVGRGPLAGPIVCASVILDLHDQEKIIEGINDSKKIRSREMRETLSERIKDKAKNFKIIEISNEEIDVIGIGEANQRGLRESVLSLGGNIDLVLSDGYMVKNLGYRNIYVIKGDSKSATIMCASIIAKVYRDNLMFKYHEEFPMYDFINNVGYGTKKHVDAIKEFGISPYHRKSFLKNYI